MKKSSTLYPAAPTKTPKKSHFTFLSPSLMKKRKGFTLIELMIAMAIIAILATAGIQAYSGYVKKGRDTARAEIASNLNTAVMSYAASNGGNPPTSSQAFSDFLASTSEIFGGSGGGGPGSLGIEDPAGGAQVCLDAEGEATQVCSFHYTAYSDGTYAISYGVEHTSSREGNFYKTENSVPAANAADDTVPVPRYGVYIGSAKYIGQDPTISTSSLGVDMTDYSFPQNVLFKSARLDTPTVTSNSGGGTPPNSVADNGVCADDVDCISATCTSGFCATTPGSVALNGACPVGNECAAGLICVLDVCSDPCEQPSAEAGTVCADETVYVTSTMRTTQYDEGNIPWHLECSWSDSWAQCVNTGATSTTNGAANTATLASLPGTYGAADTCAALESGGHDDWYLPAKNELDVLYNNKMAIGNFMSSPGVAYWPSTQVSFDDGWSIWFSNGVWFGQDKSFFNRVRCIRTP